MILGTLFTTWLHGRQVGTDQFGNRYFESKTATQGGVPKRSVLYKGALEASKVPPEWHAWLHYTTEAPVTRSQRPWQKEHVPNLTGTVHAYLPPGHDQRGGQRDRATGDYEPWTPV
ncbi:MAG: NADH:ubiquinone oxidoreductase subunit NDUFA12 [Rhodospirillaceae bacterium]